MKLDPAIVAKIRESSATVSRRMRSCTWSTASSTAERVPQEDLGS